MHALIIEDEYFVVEALEQTLREVGFTSFDDANCVAEAVRAASRRCPDLIVADYRLVDGTGAEAVLAICTGQSTPVVFVTASGEDVRAKLPSAIIVSKPFVSGTLHGAIREAWENPFVCHQIS